MIIFPSITNNNENAKLLNYTQNNTYDLRMNHLTKDTFSVSFGHTSVEKAIHTGKILILRDADNKLLNLFKKKPKEWSAAKVQELFAEGASPNARKGVYNETCLQHIALQDNFGNVKNQDELIKIVDTFFAHPDIDPNIQDRFEETFLSTTRNPKLVEIALGHKDTDPNILAIGNHTLIQDDGLSGYYYDKVKIIAEDERTDLNAFADDSQNTFLMILTESKDMSDKIIGNKFREKILKFFNFNQEIYDRPERNLDLFRFLLTDPGTINRINVNAQNIKGNAALHIAIKNKNVAKVRALCDHLDINPLLENHKKITPYYLAQKSGNKDIIEILEDCLEKKHIKIPKNTKKLPINLDFRNVVNP